MTTNRKRDALIATAVAGVVGALFVACWAAANGAMVQQDPTSLMPMLNDCLLVPAILRWTPVGLCMAAVGVGLATFGGLGDVESRTRVRRAGLVLIATAWGPPVMLAHMVVQPMSTCLS